MDRYLFLDLDDREDAWYFGKKFLNDKDKWEKEIKTKRDELDSILELSAITNSEVHSHNISDPTKQTAFAKMRVEEQIARRKAYQEVLKFGLSHIDEEDKKIIQAFYFQPNKQTQFIIDELAIELECDPRTIYNRRKSAVLHFVDAIRELVD